MTNQRLQDALGLLQIMQNWQRFPTVVRSLSEAAQHLIRREITEQEANTPAVIPEGTYRGRIDSIRSVEESNIDSRPDVERREFLLRLSEEEGGEPPTSTEGS
jgi:hypothetical protein